MILFSIAKLALHILPIYNENAIYSNYILTFREKSR